MASSSAALVALVAAAAPARVAVMPLSATADVPATLPVALTDVVAAEVRSTTGARVITQADVTAMLSLEKQKELLGCSDDVGCIAQIGGALGVERIVSGSLSKVGSSWLIHLRLIDVKRSTVLQRADRRLKGADEDGLLDAIPALVAQLFPAPAPATAVPTQPQAGTSAAAAGRSRLGPWLVTGAGVAALLVGLLVSEPWADDGAVDAGGYTVYPGLTRQEAERINSRRDAGLIVAGAGAAVTAGGLVWRFAF